MASLLGSVCSVLVRNLTAILRSGGGRFTVASFVVAALAVIALTGCGASGDTATIDTSPGAYPSNLQAKLIGACQGDGATTAQCECEVKVAEKVVPASQVGDPVSAGMTLGDDAQTLVKRKPHAFDGGCP